jgi:DNA-binding NarL/FixJ family response regulator
MAWTTAESIEELETKSPTEEVIKEEVIKEGVIKIIIADDHVLFRAGVKNALSAKKDIKFIGEAENGSHLLHLLKGIRPDVILLDIQMPVMDGMATLPEIKKLYPEIKVIMLTMMDDQSMIIKLMELGANSYLTKMSDSEIIYETIKTCYEKEFCFNSLTNRALLNNLHQKSTSVNLQQEYANPREKEIILPGLISEEKSNDKIRERVDVSARSNEFFMSTTVPRRLPKAPGNNSELRDRILNSFSEAPELNPEKTSRSLSKVVLIFIIIAGIVAGIITAFYYYEIKP